MKIIGLCGGSGSGKGTVSELFALHGIPSVDTDKVYRLMTEKPSPCLDALCEEFGNEILAPDGSLDRSKLRLAVFLGEDAAQKRRRLNEISHKFILGRTREMLCEFADKGCAFAIVDAPLLFESGFDKECDYILSVLADKELRVLRIVKRDGLTEADARARIASQKSDEELIKLSDYTIVNNGDISELRSQVLKVVEQITEKR